MNQINVPKQNLSWRFKMTILFAETPLRLVDVITTISSEKIITISVRGKKNG